ncbi:DUF5133 domain-containing protein [Streptomyces sp. NPDC048550]|uniref:DUF5133 domain-containing protein n=1 Tax=unclassified Streptomyces TaxID=2593676 RepID=UPI00343B362D
MGSLQAPDAGPAFNGRLSAVPDDDDARRAVEDTLFTLRVLMAQPSAYAALRDAVQYVDS